MARVAVRKKEVDSRDLKAGQDHKAIIALEGPAQITVEDIETAVPGPAFKDHADGLAFAEEMVMIMIHPSSDPYPEDPVYVCVNGRGCYIRRNQKTMIRRKYVERLARAKPNTISQNVSSPDPAIANTLLISSGLRYPFSLLEDKNPMGGIDWLQKLMSEA